MVRNVTLFFVLMFLVFKVSDRSIADATNDWTERQQPVTVVGTVQEIQHSERGWIVILRVESGDFKKGSAMYFGGHRKPGDFEVGKKYRVKAVQGRHGYSVLNLEPL